MSERECDKRARWLFRLGATLVIVGCGWAWLPLGFMAAGALICVSVIARITAKALDDVLKGRDIIDGSNDDDNSSP